MNAHPKKYKKETFIDFLKKNNYDDNIIKDFEKLPPLVKKKDIKYELNIIVTSYTGNRTYENFELNYYSKECLEFLFTYKIFQDIEISINHLGCQLQENEYIKNMNC